MSNWREALDSLEITTTPAAGPAGAEGEWQQLVAAFGTKGFLRALTDGEKLALECAPPGDVTAARAALEAAAWSLEGDAVPFVASRAFPDDADTLKDTWVSIAKLADATRSEDADAFHAALAASIAATEPDAPEQTAETEAPKDEAPKAESTPAEAGSAFEPIGGGARPAMTTAFAFAVAATADSIEVVLGFSEVLERHQYDELERRLIGNLRGKYDVTVSIVGGHEVSARLDVEPRTRIALAVRPDSASGLSLSDVEEAVGGYFQTLADLASSGIDPLVFLGARASKRSTGAFESIGASAAAAPVEKESSHTLLIDDAEESAEDEEEEDAVVFGGAAPLDPDAPLEPGRFDDQRLKRSDATTALVDVVVRHPGYSDRNMGQVMSILLSLDYATCLEIAERAPTVVAWGVARDRALTMKTVIEGAGGKVVLVEPGTFGES